MDSNELKSNEKIKRAMANIKKQYTLEPVDDKICKIVFDNPAASLKEIAALTDTTVGIVRRRLNKPAVRQKIGDMRMSAADLMARAQVLGMRKLMSLCMSQDEWIALQAAKLLTAPILAVSKVNHDVAGKMVFEVQIGEEGQVFRTMREATQLEKSIQPTTLDILAEIKE